VNFLLRLLARCFSLLPLPVALAVGRGLGRLVGCVMTRRRREGAAALAASLPEYTPAAARSALWRLYANLGMNVVETLRMRHLSAEELRSRIEVGDTPAAVDALRQGGKGILVIIAHVGNWEMLATATGAYGYPLGIIVKDLKPPSLNDYITAQRAQHGTQVFSRRGSLRKALKHVKDNGLLGFMMDQNAKREEGVFVNFFGRPACTTRGLAQIAHLTGAPALPIFMIRLPGGRHEIRYFEPIPPPADLSEETVREYTQRAVDAVERVIRQVPDQWIWMHRRWRTRPPETGSA
jgi:KDO2-lipid IV(A) lauroyltransferase